MEITRKTPEEWLQFITNERKTYSGPNKYKYWMQLYRRAADSIPANELAHNNNAYAKIMVDFAKLQARTSEDDARTIFQAARSNVKYCSLIYVAWAQFELLNNNRKKCIKVLEKGKQFCAKPGYLLDIALENFKSGSDQLIDDETEEYTFTELINTNVSKTEDLTDLKVRRRTSDSSLESTSSSLGSFSPECAQLTESSEESDDVIFLKTVKPLRSTNLSCIEEAQPDCIASKEDVGQNVKSIITTTSCGEKVGQRNATTSQSSFLNDILEEKQLNSATFTKPTVSIAENATCKSNLTTTNPSSSEISLRQLTMQRPTEAEFKVLESKCSNAKNIHDTTSSDANKENTKELALPVFPSKRKKDHTASSSESGDDIDALSLKSSLLNIGNKTGLMDFATPRNKGSDQIRTTTTMHNNVVGGSLVKERKSNRRKNRSIFVGLPQRVPKPMKDESKTGQEQETKATRIELKENDSVDGVYHDPEVDRQIEANLKQIGKTPAQLSSKFSKLGSDLRQRMPLASITLNTNNNTPTNLKSFQYKQQNPVRYVAGFGQPASRVCPKKNVDSVIYTSNQKSSESDHSQNDISKFNSFSHSTPATEKADATPMHSSTQAAPQEANFSVPSLSKPPSQKQNETSSCVSVFTSEESGKDSDPNFNQSGHSNQTLSSHNGSHRAVLAPKNIRNHPEDCLGVRTSTISGSHNGSLKSASLTLPNSSISMNRTSSGRSHLNNSLSGFQSDVVKNVPRMPGENDSRIQSITVNGKLYRKLNMIGRGGSSEVYTVFDSDYAQYALKYVDIKNADVSTVESYINEITLLKRLQGHESIIKLCDWEIDEVNNVIKIVLERGSTDLAGYLRKHPDKITVDFIKMCWRKMLDAVDVIHTAGIIHTDLKPANFLLVEWNLKLIDFGIANAVQNDVTSFYRDTTVGTLSYMSPEALKDVSQSQDQNEQRKPTMKIGRPSDVWSLGCILYVMVYGKTPFQHIKNNFHKWSCIIDPSYEIKFPYIENQDLLDSMKGCLRRNPSERYTIAQLKCHPFLTGRTSANDVDNVLSCLVQMQDIKSPRTLRTFAQNLVGHLSSGSSLNMTSIQPCQKSKEK